MIPVLDEKQRVEIEAVSDLKAEVNVKEILF
jgi:isoleucyl-tRNA synthetase